MNKFQILLVSGLVSLGSSLSSSAYAVPQQAYVSGSSTLVLMNGASISVGAEVAAPRGSNFSGASTDGTTFFGDLTVDPVVTNDLSSNVTSMSSLSLIAGTAIAPGSPGGSIEAAVATKINTPATLSDGVSYTRAWKSGLE